jgi:hypothetical protein
MSLTAGVAVSQVVIVICVLVVAQVVVLEVVATGVAAVVGFDMAVVRGGFRCRTRGWGVSCGRGGQPGSQRRRS